MRRQQYMDPNQMQQQQQQYNNYAAYPAAADPVRQGGDAYNYVASSRPSDGQQQQQHWNWDPNSAKDPNLISSYPTGYTTEGQAPNLGQQNPETAKAQTPPTNNTSNKLQTGYQDINNNNNINNAAQTVESLEQKFLQDINKLSKEHNEAEDSEISRHRERLNEISAQFHEKLAAVRSNHLKQREELVKKEAQIRFQQYQQYNHSPNPNPAPAPLPSGAHQGYPPYPVPYGAELAQQYPPGGGYGVEVKQQAAGYPGGYGGAEVQHRPPYPGPAAGHYEYGYPAGRGYNAGGRQF